MLDVRFLCSNCNKITSYRPGLTNEYATEPINCEHCESYVGDFVYSPNEKKVDQ
ncbi:hypothetical protein [Nitrosopumilus cobalaminigenes]|uniref:hypothetical protein n=1 Tax=Nitrosopumilus cobalaminigenes TaxID=1470066 RepID=UPI0015CBE4AC|nr:hypothetical protein [Nitrosopumilus cobalaminigenes]